MPEPTLEMSPTVTARPPAGFLDRLAVAADWLAVAVAVSLPWSTSATGILIALWLLAVIPTLDPASVRREVMSAAGGLPVLLWALAAVGMLWADVSWTERLGGLGAFHKLLLIPLLLAQFRRSGHAQWVVLGLLASAGAVLIFSWALVFFPKIPWQFRTGGVPVKDYIWQSGLFAICGLALLSRASDLWRSQMLSALLLFVVGAFFLVNIFYVATGRTTVVVLVVLLLVLSFRQFGWKGGMAVVLVCSAVAGAIWTSSPYLRKRVISVVTEVQSYPDDPKTSAGERIDFWKHSVAFIAEAPLIGHGTGSIMAQFRRAAQTDATAPVTRNPHSQVLTVAIQLGVIGTALLIAMWIAHLMLFRDAGPIALFGLMVVVQNIVGSLFNSHIGDFTQGWFYVFGVGVLGGAVLRGREAAS
jgi:O-antigen ligase